MKKIAARIAAALAAVALATPALACDYMKTNTTTSASKKPAVASKSSATQEKGAAKVKAAPESKPVSAAN